MSAPAYRIEGGDRPSRWLVTCDHASNAVPPWVGPPGSDGGDLGLPAADMARHGKRLKEIDTDIAAQEERWLAASGEIEALAGSNGD